MSGCIGPINVGVVTAISVWVGLTCRVVVATGLTGLWSGFWVGELDPPGKLQAEKTARSKRVSDRNLNDFNVAFMNMNEVTMGQGKRKPGL